MKRDERATHTQSDEKLAFSRWIYNHYFCPTYFNWLVKTAKKKFDKVTFFWLHKVTQVVTFPGNELLLFVE